MMGASFVIMAFGWGMGGRFTLSADWWGKKETGTTRLIHAYEQ